MIKLPSKQKRIMIEMVAFLAIIIGSEYVWSTGTTYYVRTDGGTYSQCTGLVNSAYPGSGTNQACAWSHPSVALGVASTCRASGGTAHIVGGDTVIIANGSYAVGCGMPGANSCAYMAASSTQCTLLPLPDGTVGNETKILGQHYNDGCATKPELYGIQKDYTVLSLNGVDYGDVECLEITDHVACNYRIITDTACHDSYPYGDWAQTGIRAKGFTNSTLKNLYIHGLASTGIIGSLWDTVTLDHVQTIGNPSAGINLDTSDTGVTSDAQAAGAGPITLTNVTVQWNGCVESYPVGSYSECSSQSQTGYGDGLGTNKLYGTVNVTDSNFSWNTSDGLDLLYARGASSNTTINRVRAEGNAGNAIKFAQTTALLENSIAIANCGFFTENGYAATRSQDDPRMGNKSACSGGVVNAAVFTGSGLNDGKYQGTYTGDRTHNPSYTAIIDSTGTPDTFKWKKDSGAYTTGVAITGAAQSLGEGVTITFTATTGHTLNDQWVGTTIGCSFDNCRAGADAIAVTINPSANIKILNSTIIPQGNYAVYADANGCNGTETLQISNVLAQGQSKYLGGGSPAFYANASCPGLTVTKSNDIAYGFNSNPSGTNMSYTNPNLTGPLGIASYDVTLTAQSTNAIGNGDKTVGVTDSNDFTNGARGALWDIGAYEYQVDVTPPICGNGIKETGEACDDGNTISCDGCSASCQIESCGNGIIECSEACDNGALNGTAGNPCAANCTLAPICGNGIIDTGEQCDDGNTTACDGCSATCQVEVCGNGIVECSETCDDGNTVSGDGCSATCQKERVSKISGNVKVSGKVTFK